MQRYAGEDDVCQSLYPKSFEGVVPRSVLKALRYYRYGEVCCGVGRGVWYGVVWCCVVLCSEVLVLLVCLHNFH